MTSDLDEINNIEFDELNQSPEDFLPHPKNYKNWFTFYDEIDLRRHLQDVEIVLKTCARPRQRAGNSRC